ncbi:nucleotide-binding protein [Actinomadura terrae]|uniref:nucleotide-binding protein n=1 Tax=Actinomadura terrae TaxID=604353 RepID=UPI001FA7D60D|nr:hypothetical protein [Actinomadura terrae]
MADQDRDVPPPDPDLTVVDAPKLHRHAPQAQPPPPPPPTSPPPAFGQPSDLSVTRPDQPPPRANPAPPPPPPQASPAPPPRPAPLVVPTAPETLVQGPVHGDSVMRRVLRGALHPFRSADDVREVTEHGRWIAHPVTTGRRIAVMGVREGSGKSTVSALVTTAFARHRDDRVLALDLDPEMGSLPLRLGVRNEHPVADLAGADLSTASFEQVRQFLVPLGERLWALPTTYGTVGAGRGLVDAGRYQSAGVQLSRFFGVTVADNGAGTRTPLHRAVLAAAHAQILVAPATVDGAAAVGRVLDWMGSGDLRALLPRTLVVFTSHTPHKAGTVDVDRAAGILAEVGVNTIRLGFDRQLAVGTTLDHARLAYATRLTAIAIAAEALRLALTV